MMSKMAAVLCLLVAAAAVLPSSAQQWDEEGKPKEYGIYCGKENCYEVLGVEPDATDVRAPKEGPRDLLSLLIADLPFPGCPLGLAPAASSR